MAKYNPKQQLHKIRKRQASHNFKPPLEAFLLSLQNQQKILPFVFFEGVDEIIYSFLFDFHYLDPVMRLEKKKILRLLKLASVY
jgi:hypothetical protein